MFSLFFRLMLIIFCKVNTRSGRIFFMDQWWFDCSELSFAFHEQVYICTSAFTWHRGLVVKKPCTQNVLGYSLKDADGVDVFCNEAIFFKSDLLIGLFYFYLLLWRTAFCDMFRETNHLVVPVSQKLTLLVYQSSYSWSWRFVDILCLCEYYDSTVGVVWCLPYLSSLGVNIKIQIYNAF